VDACRCINCALCGLTDRLIVYRVAREMGMALELKGLKGKAVAARSNIERLNTAYDVFNQMAPAHASDVEGMAHQVEQMNEDLGFAVTTLGNSTAPSEKPAENQTASPPPVPKATPEVGQNALTFPEGK
jgi:hypothetical protein